VPASSDLPLPCSRLIQRHQPSSHHHLGPQPLSIRHQASHPITPSTKPSQTTSHSQPPLAPPDHDTQISLPHRLGSALSRLLLARPRGHRNGGGGGGGLGCGLREGVRLYIAKADRLVRKHGIAHVSVEGRTAWREACMVWQSSLLCMVLCRTGRRIRCSVTMAKLLAACTVPYRTVC
jgi:hypothetical protein